MAFEHINNGAAPNDGTGDTLREAIRKVNDNFDTLTTQASEAGAASGATAGATAGAAAAAPSAGVATTQAGIAAAAAGTATAQAGISNTKAGESATSAASALAAKVAAEAARDSINTTGKVFTNAEGTAAGIAATTNGQQFAVLAVDSLSYGIYRNNSGTALLMPGGGFYTKLFIDALAANTPVSFESLDPSLPPAMLLDADRRILARLPDPAIAALASSAVTFGQFEALESLKFLILDAENRIIASVPVDAVSASDFAPVQAEVTAARGTRSALADRLARGLTGYGDPISPYANFWSLREVRFRTQKRAISEAIQLVMALIGDSYTQANARYSGAFAKALQDKYGMAGVGWVGFGWFGTAAGTWTIGAQPAGLDGSVRVDLVTITQIIGTWTCSYNASANNTPSLSRITSSTVDDYVRFNFPATHNACRLFYAGDGTGVIAVSWDDGVTYGADIALNTAGAANVLLTGIPATAATARIKVRTGNVSLAGVDLQSAASGVRVHKLGGSGSAASQWAAVTPATWAAQMLALGSHAHQVMHGTNDQSGGPTPAAFSANVGTIFTNIKTVLPYSDRVIVMPPENQRTTNPVAMTAYAQAAREYAVANDCAYLDLQYLFGSPANFAFEYANANAARPWYAADLIHPDPNTGGRVIVDGLSRLYLNI